MLLCLPTNNSLPRALADGGYDCGLVGKWHLSACFGGRTEPRLDDGFRFFEWAHDPTHGSPANMYHQWLAQNFPDLYAQASANGPGRHGHEAVAFDTMPTEAHYSHWVGEKSLEFIRTAHEPFFLWVNFFDPHHPFVAPQEYLDRYDPAGLPPPIGNPAELATKPAILTEASLRSYAGHARGFADYSTQEIQSIIAANYAMVSLIDDEVGRILTALEAAGQSDGTVVIFTSDHGEMQGDHGLLLKGPMMYEGAVHVPLIMRWPGVLPANVRRPELVQWIDLCPTILDAAGLPPLSRSQAQSLLPLARDEANNGGRGWALCEYRDSGHPYEPPVYTTMLRTDRFKLIVHHGQPATGRVRTGELYAMESDPEELHNLWDDPDYAEVRIGLQEWLLDVLVANEDRSQTREAFW